MKKEKIGLTPINWFLSIIGIIILSCMIILPPVFRVVFKEDEIIEIPEEIILEKLVCEKDEIASEGHTDKIIYTFDHYKDQVYTYTKKTEKTYTDYVLYTNDKQQYGRYNAAFSILVGYKYVMEPDDVNYVLTIDEEYDLTTFKNTEITIPGETEETKVISRYNMNDSVVGIKNNLVNDGYICQ